VRSLVFLVIAPPDPRYAALGLQTPGGRCLSSNCAAL